MQRIILPGEVGFTVEPRLTVDGLRDMLQDMRRAGRRMPNAILVSEYDRRDLNQDLMAGAVHEVAKEDQRPEHDGQAIGMIEGVVIGSSPHVARGKARLVYPPEKKEVNDRLGGEGVIMIGGPGA